MTENNAPPAAIPLDEELTGRQRIRAMLMAKGQNISSWARLREIDHEEQVHMMLAGRRPYPEIRDLLAVDLGLTRQQLDDIIPLPPAEGAA